MQSLTFKSSLRTRFPAALIGLLGLAWAPLADGALKLEFTEGGSTSEPNYSAVDAYPGSEGEGWEWEWTTVGGPTRSALNVEVREETPFSSDSQTYLQMEYTDLAPGVSDKTGVQRAFSTEAGSEGIDPTKPYHIRFQFRLDSASEEFATKWDNVMFSGSIATETPGVPRGGEDLWELNYRWELGWLVKVRGTESVHRFGPANLRLQPGVIWTVKISLRPDLSLLDIELEDSEGLLLETRGLEVDLMPSGSPPAFLNFLMSRKGTGKTATWSIDNIEVNQD